MADLPCLVLFFAESIQARGAPMSLVRQVASGDRGEARTVQGNGRDPQGRKFKVFVTWHANFELLLATYDVKVCLRPGQNEVSKRARGCIFV